VRCRLGLGVGGEVRPAMTGRALIGKSRVIHHGRSEDDIILVTNIALTVVRDVGHVLA
jgi:hypothetical protein